MTLSESFDTSGVAEFSYPKEVVFRALQQAVGLVKGMKMQSADPAQGIIQAKTAASGWSWGENVTLSVSGVAAWSSQVQVTSSAKMAMNISASGKNWRNFQDLIQKTSDVLDRNGDSWAQEFGFERQQPQASSAGVSQSSVADEMKKLAELRDSGILTEDEFATQKARLLDQQ